MTPHSRYFLQSLPSPSLHLFRECEGERRPTETQSQGRRAGGGHASAPSQHTWLSTHLNVSRQICESFLQTVNTYKWLCSFLIFPSDLCPSVEVIQSQEILPL